MVKDPGTAIRTHRLRPLAAPRLLAVETDGEGHPCWVVLGGEQRRVVGLQDRWRIDDEWWREQPVSRMYYQLQLEGDRVVTIYCDLDGGAWCVQRY